MSFDKLEEIFRLQQVFDKRAQARSSFMNLNHDAQLLYLLDMLVEEAIEARRKIPSRKWWKNPTPILKDELFEELIDCLHFLVSSLLKLGMTSEHVYREYCRKMKINISRLEKTELEQ